MSKQGKALTMDTRVAKGYSTAYRSDILSVSEVSWLVKAAAEASFSHGDSGCCTSCVCICSGTELAFSSRTLCLRQTISSGHAVRCDRVVGKLKSTVKSSGELGNEDECREMFLSRLRTMDNTDATY